VEVAGEPRVPDNPMHLTRHPGDGCPRPLAPCPAALMPALGCPGVREKLNKCIL